MEKENHENSDMTTENKEDEEDEFDEYSDEDTEYSFPRQRKKVSSISRNMYRPQKRKPCPYCSRMITTGLRFKKHIDRVHMKNSNYTCPNCGHSFSSNGNLHRHMRTYHAETTEVVSCPHPGCPKEFINKNYLKLHLKRHDNTKKEPYSLQCP